MQIVHLIPKNAPRYVWSKNRRIRRKWLKRVARRFEYHGKFKL